MTLPPRWLRVSCSAAGLITARWKRALGLEDAPSVEFTATVVAVEADGADGDALEPYTGADRRYTVAGTPGAQYRVTVRTAPVAGFPVYTETRTKQCKPAAPTGVEVECTASNRVVVKWSPAAGADSYKASVTGRTQAPARPSVDTRTVAHFDPPVGQKLALPVPGTIGWDYTATVTSVKTLADSELASAPAQSAGSVRCEGVEAQCQADGRLKATWARNPAATRYRLQISATATTSTQPAQLAPILVEQPAQAARTISHYYENARAGTRYEVSVEAEIDSAFTVPTTPASDTCDAIAPPAPTGVTASCQAGMLTVEWDPAGKGLAEATAYKPRIFTGAIESDFGHIHCVR